MNSHTEDHSSSPTQPAATDGDLVWYRRGREYLGHLAVAADAFHAYDHDFGEIQEEAADRQLWPLDTAEADDLRAFVAGIHREAEQQLRQLRERDPMHPTHSLANPVVTGHDPETPSQDDSESTLSPNIEATSVLLQDALSRIANPTTRTDAFGTLGIIDFSIRKLVATGHDEGADYDALIDCTDGITQALDGASTGDLRMFISGQAYAHGRGLY